jgi:Glycosyltransferase family 87
MEPRESPNASSGNLKSIDIRQAVKTTSAPSTLMKWLATVIFVAGVLSLARFSYAHRMRYRAPAMADYYQWSLELRLGGDPWVRQACNYPPAFVLSFEPLTMLPQASAYWVWQATLVGSLIVATLFTIRECKPGVEPAFYLLAIGAVLLFPQVHGALYESELTLLLLALLVGAWRCDRHSEAAAAGLMLAGATLLKVFPLLVGGYFLLRRRWNSIRWTIVFVLAGLLLCGLRYDCEFIRFGIFNSSYVSDDRWLVVSSERSIAIMAQLRTLLDKLYRGALPPAAYGLWVGLTAGASLLSAIPVVIVTLWGNGNNELDGLCFGLWMMLAVMASPISWAHSLPFALPLMISLALLIAGGARWNAVACLLLVAGLLGMIFPFFSSPLRHTHMYFWATISMYAGGCCFGLIWSRTASCALDKRADVGDAYKR